MEAEPWIIGVWQGGDENALYGLCRFLRRINKKQNVLEIQTQVFLWFWSILFGLTDFVSVRQIFMVCQTECLTVFFNFREVCRPTLRSRTLTSPYYQTGQENCSLAEDKIFYQSLLGFLPVHNYTVIFNCHICCATCLMNHRCNFIFRTFHLLFFSALAFLLPFRIWYCKRSIVTY
jgi:hypothetical protein